MENVNVNEKAIIIDEQLDNVSGGNNTPTTFEVYCDICHKRVFKFDIVSHHNQQICKTCMENLTNK